MLSGRTDLSISPETREKVLEAARQLGYTPNSAAKALTCGKSGIVGFWMSLEYSRYRGQVLDCMRTLLRGTEVAIAVTDVDEEYNLAHSFDRALRVPADGIIAFDNSASVEAFARESSRLAPLIPFVSMGAYWSSEKSYVGIDLKSGAMAAMNHLFETGRKRIAYVAPWTSDLIDSGPRFEAYQESMQNRGLECMTIGVQSVTYGLVKEAIDESVDSGDLPDALLCMNDEIAITAQSVLMDRGIAVGRDVAIVGFDGIEETAHCPVPITTVVQPIYEMCYVAWDFLKTQMEDPSGPLLQRVLVPELVVRESSRR